MKEKRRKWEIERGWFYTKYFRRWFTITVRSSEYFIYNNVDSRDHGIYNVNINVSSLLEEPFIAPSEIREINSRHHEKPFFQSNQRKVLVFNLTFASDDSWVSNSSTLQSIVQWLCSPKIYKELSFSDDLTKKYFAIYEGFPRLFHNGNQGYIELIFRTNSPYAFSNLQTRDI